MRVDFKLPLPEGRARVYAIAFDMDIESLRQHYGDPYNTAYLEIRRVLQSHGFRWQQGSVYFGTESMNAVTCVLAAQDLATELPWFAHCVRDIRMLRIEEFNNLMPAVAAGGGIVSQQLTELLRREVRLLDNFFDQPPIHVPRVHRHGSRTLAVRMLKVAVAADLLSLDKASPFQRLDHLSRTDVG